MVSSASLHLRQSISQPMCEKVQRAFRGSILVEFLFL